MDEVYLDVSELAPPDPMTKILMALVELKSGHYIKVAHSRQPHPLYEKLVSAGWGYYCLSNPNSEEIYIRHFIYIFRIAEQHRLPAFIRTNINTG